MVTMTEEERRQHRAQVQRDYRARLRLEKGPEKISSPQVYKSVAAHPVSRAQPEEKLYTKDEVKGLLKELIEMRDQDEKPPVKPSRRERKRQRKLEYLQHQMEKYGGETIKHEIPVSHLVGKPLQFASEKPTVNKVSLPQKIIQKQTRKKAKQVFTEQIPEALPPEDLDIVEEQVEKPQTTKHSPESIKEDGIRDVKRHPEEYIEINMVTRSRIVEDRKSVV